MTTIETNKKSSELMQVTDIKDVSKVDLWWAKEVVDQIETWWIKEKLKNMEEKIRPYKGISKDLSTLQDFIYKQSWWKRNLGNKEGTISYKNNTGTPAQSRTGNLALEEQSIESAIQGRGLYDLSATSILHI